MRDIKEIIVHCSDTNCGTEEGIREYHMKQRHWADIGYHFVILNGMADSTHTDIDGSVVPGRPEEEVGAHCENHNAHSIGVCLVGEKQFTTAQYQALKHLLISLMDKYSLTAKEVHCHYEYDTAKAQGKTCPNIDVLEIRDLLQEEFKLEPKG